MALNQNDFSSYPMRSAAMNLHNSRTNELKCDKMVGMEDNSVPENYLELSREVSALEK